MRRVILEKTANQEFNLTIDDRRYKISLREGENQMMLATIEIDGEIVIQGLRCLPSTPLLPYSYTEWGNFIFVTENNEFPYWEKFGSSQRLLYVTRAEVEDPANEL